MYLGYFFFDLMGAKPADFIKYPTINLPSFKKIPPGSGKPADIIQNILPNIVKPAISLTIMPYIFTTKYNVVKFKSSGSLNCENIELV